MWLDPANKILNGTYRSFCGRVKIPVGTLHPYIHPDITKRKLEIDAPSRPRKIRKDVSVQIVDAVILFDRLEKGVDSCEIKNFLGTVAPNLTQKQVANCWNSTIKPENTDRLTGRVVAVKSSSKRTGNYKI